MKIYKVKAMIRVPHVTYIAADSSDEAQAKATDDRHINWQDDADAPSEFGEGDEVYEVAETTKEQAPSGFIIGSDDDGSSGFVGEKPSINDYRRHYGWPVE
jgi:hypothetical protein